MSELIVRKSGPLFGTVLIGGSKNAVLPILCACLLTQERCEIRQVPPFADVLALLGILRALGADVEYDEKKQMVHIQARRMKMGGGGEELAGRLRASFLVLGPILARKGRAQVPLPGGCPIGTRPVDLHLKGLTALGARIRVDHGMAKGRCRILRGTEVYLDLPSVGATENLLMAATLAQGVTVIENAAAEPEIVDLAAFLKKMGAKIQGAGTPKITITGVDSLHGARHSVMSDRVETGTFLAAVAITGGDVVLKNTPNDHLAAILAKLREAGAVIEEGVGSLHIKATGEILPFDVKTMPYPGFPTDLQAVFMALAAVAKGTSVITETLFENRFLQAAQLNRMRAGIKTDGRVAVVEGVRHLTGTAVTATDLRAGAALVVAALAAEGETQISHISHIDRGYDHLEEKLQGLGAEIFRQEEPAREAMAAAH